MTRRDDAHLLSGAYSVDAVTPDEAALVETAMHESEDLHSEIVGLVDTAVALGLAVPPVSPPPALRSRLLAAIEDLPQEQVPAHAETRVVPAMPAGDHVAPRRRRRFARSRVLAASAAVALMLFSGGFLLQRAVLQPQTDYSQVTMASDVQSASASVKGGGAVTVAWSAGQRRTAIALPGVQIPSGKAVQLWHVRGGSVTSAGLYEPYDVIEGTPKSGDSLAVSFEPPGGSKRPSTIIAVVPFQA